MTAPDPLGRWATWREIHAQPAVWRDWLARFDAGAVADWTRAQGVGEVWFCGAGTSAYIGDIIVAGLEGAEGPRLRAVPTTDLVSRPRAYLGHGQRPLVVSFGRSGNSTESVGVLDCLDALAPDAPRLNITCNPDGALATRGPGRVVLLPEATHDAGFAMTSSFSTMLLSALAIFDPAGRPDPVSLAMSMVAALAQSEAIARAADLPERIVFVGSGPLAYAARESALKVMELTAGAVPALWDSTLGFRHGPKSFVTGRTMIVALASADAHSALYDADLIHELATQFPDCPLVTIGPKGADILTGDAADLWSAPVYLAFAQVAGALWSDRLGLNVDDPFAGRGTLSRVVSGVRLHGAL